MCVDRSGNLWVSTGRGLNMFNGQRVTRYFAEQYPQMQNNLVMHVTCDSLDHIWLLTAGGNVTMLDQKRNPHRVGLYRNGKFISTSHILVSQHGGIILRTREGHFRFQPPARLEQNDSLRITNFSYLAVKGMDTSLMNGIRQVLYYDDDRYVYKINHSFYLVNFRTASVEHIVDATNLRALLKWNANALLVYDVVQREMKAVDFSNSTSTYPFRKLKDQYGGSLTSNVVGAAMMRDGQYIFLTFSDGIFIYDSKLAKLSNYRNDAANPTSLSRNRQTNVCIGHDGWVFVNCRPSGISYFNHNDIIGNQNVFLDKKGNGYNGYIASLATTDNNTFLLGTTEGLLQWKRDINATTFVNYPDGKGDWLIRKEEVTSIVIDKRGNAWVATARNGILVIDRQLKLLKHLPVDTLNGKGIPIPYISQVVESPRGDIWVSGTKGICRINPLTYAIENMKGNPVLASNEKYYPMLFSDPDHLWVGITNKGVFHYNLGNGDMKAYTRENGLSNLVIYALDVDASGTLHVGTAGGLTVFYPDGKSRTFTQKEGLLIDGAEGLLRDGANRLWVGNDIGLACYNSSDSSFKTFDERYGLSIYGFLIGAYFRLSNGEFMFGTPRGLQYFFPDSLLNKKLSLNVAISNIETRNIHSAINGSESFRLQAFDNHVTFTFSSVDFTPHVRTYYQYRLEGVDKDWLKIADQNAVTYTNLPPGRFTFRVKISNDGKHWQMSSNTVSIEIARPFYSQWWFLLLIFLLLLGLLYFFYRQVKRRQAEKQLNLETELVITYFASQINSHKSTELLLWDIAKNCISQLNFRDCVIYLVDESRQVLVQKAAYGPKNPVDIQIDQPIEIPVGKGISGYVAQTGIAEIVDDTSKDSRYIVDDERRYSEIAVPILLDQKVIGVIDSEHPHRRFFTSRHKQILSTIAFLCANQMMKIEAEIEKQQTVIELLENRQKAAESRLQSLRLQMNPHFLFNALNSIQQMILANEDMVATSYLSRFSKLLRAILVSSDKETITLKEEIEILKMYVELESVRFRDAFSFTIQFDDDMDIEEIRIPSLLIQPFVENAIWHGLMHKEGDRKLSIRFHEKDHFVQCIVEDNGVGRAAAGEWKTATGRDKKHTGKGIAVAEERLRTHVKPATQPGSIEVVDLYEKGQAAGTRIVINFPNEN